MMKLSIHALFLPLLVLVPACKTTEPEVARPNELTAREKDEGWKLLFDGQTTRGWRGYKKEEAPGGWQVVDGALTTQKMQALRALGDPYSDEEIAGAAAAVTGKTELDAVIAYLQGLGRHAPKAPAVANAANVKNETNDAGGRP